MKNDVLIFMLLIGFLSASTGKAADDYPIRDAVECTVRRGLPNFFNKLENGKEVLIGYLGGSVTDQKGYRVLSEKWFASQYPDARVTGINAGLGGTGSDLGLFRLRSELLDHHPDMIFVEFSGNDRNTPSHSIVRAMEGIVRQTWATWPDCDICFLYTIKQDELSALQAGRMQRTASVMEAVAEHYGIPAIHLGMEIGKLEKQGKLLFKAKREVMTSVAGDELNVQSDVPVNNDGKIPFTGDGVHPYLDTGHQIYMNVIARSMNQMRSMNTPILHQLPEPLDRKNWENAKVVPIRKNLLSGNVRQLDPHGPISERFAHRIPGIFEAQPGSTMQFAFIGSKVMIYDLLGPGCAQVRITVDGNSRTLDRVDSYSVSYRLTLLNVADNLDPTKKHIVEIKVLDEKFDKAKILQPRHPGVVTKDPAKFEPINWYPCAIMIVGEMVSE